MLIIAICYLKSAPILNDSGLSDSRYHPLREKRSNTEFFWSVVSSPNTGKYRPEKTLSSDIFHALIELDFVPLAQNKDFAKHVSKQGVQMMHH